MKSLILICPKNWSNYSSTFTYPINQQQGIEKLQRSFQKQKTTQCFTFKIATCETYLFKKYQKFRFLHNIICTKFQNLGPIIFFFQNRFGPLNNSTEHSAVHIQTIFSV